MIYYSSSYLRKANYKHLYHQCLLDMSDKIEKETIEDYLSDNPKSYSTLETAKETEALNKYLLTAKVYFEYGSGGSTFEALKNSNVQKVYSVENSRSWLDDFMYRFKFIRDNEKNGRLDLIYVDTDETGDWGYPLDETKDYSAYPGAFAQDEAYQDADLILVDGRYRAACMLQVLQYAKPEALVMLHDSERQYYHEVYQFFDKVDQIDKLAVFKIKEDLDMEKIQELYEKYKKDPR